MSQPSSVSLAMKTPERFLPSVHIELKNPHEVEASRSCGLAQVLKRVPFSPGKHNSDCSLRERMALVDEQYSSTGYLETLSITCSDDESAFTAATAATIGAAAATTRSEEEATLVSIISNQRTMSPPTGPTSSSPSSPRSEVSAPLSPSSSRSSCIDLGAGGRADLASSTSTISTTTATSQIESPMTSPPLCDRTREARSEPTSPPGTRKNPAATGLNRSTNNALARPVVHLNLSNSALKHSTGSSPFRDLNSDRSGATSTRTPTEPRSPLHPPSPHSSKKQPKNTSTNNSNSNNSNANSNGNSHSMNITASAASAAPFTQHKHAIHADENDPSFAATVTTTSSPPSAPTSPRRILQFDRV